MNKELEHALRGVLLVAVTTDAKSPREIDLAVDRGIKKIQGAIEAFGVEEDES